SGCLSIKKTSKKYVKATFALKILKRKIAITTLNAVTQHMVTWCRVMWRLVQQKNVVTLDMELMRLVMPFTSTLKVQSSVTEKKSVTINDITILLKKKLYVSVKTRLKQNTGTTSKCIIRFLSIILTKLCLKYTRLRTTLWADFGLTTTCKPTFRDVMLLAN